MQRLLVGQKRLQKAFVSHIWNIHFLGMVFIGALISLNIILGLWLSYLMMSLFITLSYKIVSFFLSLVLVSNTSAKLSIDGIHKFEEYVKK